MRPPPAAPLHRLGTIGSHVATPVLLGARGRATRMASQPASATAPRGVLHHGVSLLNQSDAIQVDVDLMQEPGFSIDQLMELAGLSCACAVVALAPTPCRVLLVCGPGNNGGDGLVAARHLYHFGYTAEVVYPKQPKAPLFANLVAQQEQLGIPVMQEMPADVSRLGTSFVFSACTPHIANKVQAHREVCNAQLGAFGVLVDAIFGFSFKLDPDRGIRAPFDSMLAAMATASTPVLSVDIPSGWDVEAGPQSDGALAPDALISLTAPKLCATHFSGRHFLGGRFVPPAIVDRYQLSLPAYPGTSQVVELEGWGG